jgi:hypothetical protein
MKSIRLGDPDFCDKIRVKLGDQLVVRDIDVSWFNLYEHDNRRTPQYVLRIRLGGLAATDQIWGMQITEEEINSYYDCGEDHTLFVIKGQLDMAWSKLLYKGERHG